VARWAESQVNLLVPARTFKKWKFRKPKPTTLPAELFSYDKPISGSLGFEEDLAIVRNKEFEFDVQSMTSRGFLRFQKSYTPPSDVNHRFLHLVKTLNPQLGQLKENELAQYRLSDSRLKYDLLTKANDEFEHSVPNSMLYLIETIGDALKFYNAPIQTLTPFDELQKRKDLPPNLHIQKDPLRFDPATDTMFGGVTAFPLSSTVVSGLHGKKKYQSVIAKKKWLQ